MKLYFLSLGAGILAGLLYGALNVRSPAPPVIALVGLLGILLGEQAMPLLKHAFSDDAKYQLGIRARIGQHLFGHLPGHSRYSATQPPGGDLIAGNESNTGGIDHDK